MFTLVSTNLLAASEVLIDSTSPTLVSFDLDMNSGLLTLVFSESVNELSLQPNAITFYAANQSSADSYQLLISSVAVSKSSETTVEFIIPSSDLNQLKVSRDLAFFPNNTFISYTSDLIADTSANQADGKSPEDAVPVRNFTSDSSSPSLLSWDMNIDGEGNFSLHFSETIDISSLDLSQIRIQISQFVPDILINPSSSFKPSINSPDIVILFNNTDLNEIKRLQLCTSKQDCFVSYPNTALRDIFGNDVVERTMNQGLQVDSFTADKTDPELAQFIEFDKNSGEIILSFTETINASSVRISNVYLQDWYQDDSSLNSVIQLSRVVVLTADSSILKFRLSIDDLNLIKADSTLCNIGSTCWIRFNTLFVQDMSGNQIVSVLNSTTFQETERADQFIRDTTPPNLVRFELDLNDGTLLFSFDETVDVQSFDALKISFTNSVGNVSLTLTGSNILTSSNAITSSYRLLGPDLVSLKANMIFSFNDETI